MDPFQNFRLRGLFSGGTPEVSTGFPIDITGPFNNAYGADPTTPGMGTPAISSPLNAPDSNLRALRGRARPYMDQLKDFYSSEPKREEHQLSKLGKALSAASGVIGAGIQKDPAHGIGIYKSIADEPFKKAQIDYASKANRLQNLASIENTQLEDQDKLEVAIAADEAKRRDDIRQMIVAQSGMELNAAQVRKIEDDIKNGKKVISVSDLTGQRQIVDGKTGEVWNIGKVKETAEETSAREHKWFKERFGVEQTGRKEMEGIQQSNRIAIKGMDQVHDKFMENLRSSNDRLEIKLRDNLDRLSPKEQGTAFDNAYKQTLLKHPAMQNMLFDQDEKGNLSLKKDYNPDLHALFISSVNQTMTQAMGEVNSAVSAGPTGISDDPSVRDAVSHSVAGNIQQPAAQVDPALRAAAIADLTKNGVPTHEDNIALWIQQASTPQNQAPQVALPDQTPPVVGTPDVGLEAIKGIPGQIRNNIYFGDYSQPHPPVQITDPNSDTGLNTIGGLINSIRNAPQNIYDPQGLARRRTGR